MILLNNVTKYYPTRNGRKYVLKDISLSLPANKNIAIIGRNGAGKSTLLKMIGGIDFPNSGEIYCDMRISPPFGTSAGLAYELTGRDNAKFVCRIQGLGRNKLQKSVEFIKEFSELGNYFDMPVKSYSSGMYSRLAFSISMAFEFDYYLIDELTSVGDQRFRKKATAAFAEKRGRAGFILVSHNLEMHKKECDVALYLRDGCATYFEDVAEAVDTYLEAEG